MKKKILLFCLMFYCLPLMAGNKYELSAIESANRTNNSLSSEITKLTELNVGDKVILNPKLHTYEIISYESEQEKYQREQIWKYTKLGFYIVMAASGWNSRTDYGVIAGTTFMILALSVKF